MKETICIEVNLKDFLKHHKEEDIIIVRRKGKWICETKTNLFNDVKNEMQNLKDQIECFKLDNNDMRNKIQEWNNTISKMKQALIYYGFKMFKEEQ